MERPRAAGSNTGFVGGFPVSIWPRARIVSGMAGFALEGPLTMVWYLAGMALLLLLTRWVFFSLRPNGQLPAELSKRSAPEREAGQAPQRTVAQVFGLESEDAEDPQLQGEPLLNAIVQGLSSLGFSCSAPSPASYGWETEVNVDGRMFLVNGGIRGADETGASEWLVFVSLVPGKLATLKHELVPAPDAPDTRKLLSALHQVLSALPGTKNLAWHESAHFDRGDESQPAPLPF